MSAALLALILMGALLLAWPMGRAAAAPVPPSFETLTTNSDDATSITIGNPAGTADDDLLIATVIHGVTLPFFDKVVITPPGGWTPIDYGDCASNECTMGVWYKIASSEPSDYTFLFSHPAELASGAILRYSGADPANPINASGGAFGNSDAPTAPDVTSTAVHTTVLRFAGVDDDHFPGTLHPPGLTPRLLMNAEVGSGPDPSWLPVPHSHRTGKLFTPRKSGEP